MFVFKVDLLDPDYCNDKNQPGGVLPYTNLKGRYVARGLVRIGGHDTVRRNVQRLADHAVLPMQPLISDDA